MLKQRFLVFLTVVTVASCLAYCFHLLRSPGLNLLPTKQLPNVNKTEMGAHSLRDLRRSSYLNIRQFEIDGHDVMVFLHIQKTGGTSFGRSLVRSLRVERKCEKTIVTRKARYICKRPNSEEFWLYSRYSTGWICGLHADWTTWTSCLPHLLKSRLSDKSFNKTKLFYITILRDPVDRFLSELKHIQRGATWKASTYTCNNTQYKPPVCYKGSNWSSVSLREFLDCPYNFAFNRQTRMLANLTEVGCYKQKKWNRKHEKAMLESAKRNLRSMAYFALVEYQNESQYLFERTFGLKFRRYLRQVPASETISEEARRELTPKLLLEIRQANRLDRQLYSYAKALFFKRLKYLEKISK